MREIKFRAWDGKRMLFNAKGGFCDFIIEGGELSIFSEFDLRERKTPRYPIMQFTGLKDKNGTEIYEGDILHHVGTRKAGYPSDGIDIYAKIVYGEANTDGSVLTDFVGFWAVSLKDTDLSCVYSIKYRLESHGSVVIGNIYENPELLNDKN